MKLNRREVPINATRPIGTAWGVADSATEYAHGIVRYTTAGHGGFALSEDAQCQMPAALGAIAPFAGRGWYEEDCDWCLVALSFPDLFSDLEAYQAVRTFEQWHGSHSAWLTTSEGRAVVERVARFVLDNGSRFILTSMSMDGGAWSLTLRSLDGKRNALVSDVTSAEIEGSAGLFDIAMFGARAVVTAVEQATCAMSEV